MDSYDAIRSKRPYKEPKEHPEALRLLGEAAGKRLDPRLVERFASEPVSSWDQLSFKVQDVLTFEQALGVCREVGPT